MNQCRVIQWAAGFASRMPCVCSNGKVLWAVGMRWSSSVSLLCGALNAVVSVI